MFMVTQPAIIDDDLRLLESPPAVVRTHTDVLRHEVSLVPLHPPQTPWVNVTKTPSRAFRFSTQREVPLHEQEGNTCGPTSLKMVLEYFGKDVPLRELLRRARYNPVIGTSPIGLAKAAESTGLRTSLRQEVTPTTIKNILDGGGLGVALISQGDGLHYVVINGIREDTLGQTELSIIDPNGCETGWRSWRSFSKQWTNIDWRGFETGLSRCLLVIGREKLVADNFEGQGKKYAQVHFSVSETHSVWEQLLNSVSHIATVLASVLSQLGGGLTPRNAQKQLESQHQLA